MFRIVTLIIVFLVAAPFCYGFEPRFYSDFEKPDFQFKEVDRIRNHADRTISCGRNLDQIDIGIGIEVEGGLSDIVYFTRAQVHNFLKREMHKDLLIVMFEKGIMWTGPEKVQEKLAELKPFIADLGYKRVLVLGAHAAGVFVVYDTGNDKPPHQVNDR